MKSFTGKNAAWGMGVQGVDSERPLGFIAACQ